MMKTYLATSSENKTLNDLYQSSGSSRKAGGISSREVRARFIYTSARYLGVDIDYREPESRYIPG